MKKIKKVLSILLVMVLATSLMSVSAGAFLGRNATPTVVFDATEGVFSFKNVEVYEHSEEDAHVHSENVNLFPDMENLFPGDSFTMQIKLEVENANRKNVKMFLRGENPYGAVDELMGAVPEQEDEVAPVEANTEGMPLLWVTYNGKSYSARIDEGIELGTFNKNNKEAVIDVTLQIPIEAGNELQGLLAEIDWVFTAEVTNISSGGGGGGGSTEIPDEDPPLSDLPDEEPPLADLPDEEPPLAELPEEDVPLAVLPQTGLLQWPILVMGLAGLLLIALGILSEQKRKARNN